MNLFTLLEMIATADPDRIVLGDRRTGLTAAALADRAARAATALDGPGPVLYTGPAGPEFVVALFAAARAQRPFAPLSYRLAPARLRRQIDGQAPATVLGPVPAPGPDGGAPGLTEVPVDGFLDALADHSPTAVELDHDPRRPAVLLHTSGTTGDPKVAVLRHEHLTSYVLGSVDLLDAAPTDAALTCVPPYHIAGIAGVLTNLYAGRRLVQLADFDAGTWIDLVNEQRVTHAMVVPTMLVRIVACLTETGRSLPDLRHLSYGGGPMPRATIEQALDLLPHVDFVNGYGLTETTSSIAVLGPEDHRTAAGSADPAVRARLGSVGRPLPTVQMQVRDLAGREVRPGEPGELWVRGPQVSGEYAGGSQLDPDGWFRTKDAARMDDGGYLFVEGRLDDVIVRGGENLSPREIEDTLLTHPAVLEAVVFGRPDPEWGEVPWAAVTVADPLVAPAEDDLKALVARELRSSRVPVRIRILDSLPRNDLGKVMRRVLKAQALDG